MNFISEAIRLSGGGKNLSQRSRFDLYSTITLPPLDKLTAYRNTEKRVDQMKMDWKGRSIFAIGFNIGAIPFEIYKRGAFSISGIEYRKDRVEFTNLFAQHHGMNACFLQGDIHNFECERHDVVLCMSIDKHVADATALYKKLWLMTENILIIESNYKADYFTITALEKLFVNVELMTATQDGRRLYKCSTT